MKPTNIRIFFTRHRLIANGNFLQSTLESNEPGLSERFSQIDAHLVQKEMDKVENAGLHDLGKFDFYVMFFSPKC